MGVLTLMLHLQNLNLEVLSVNKLLLETCIGLASQRDADPACNLINLKLSNGRQVLLIDASLNRYQLWGIRLICFRV